ncbi:MAG: glutamate-5-semialdehyde dehydrogenase, partial [Pyrinomonadaceae bacterium]|nr:glutamate-5-semialdehyde dehydrogenase [Pyrinomonadaceae bacterium]
ACVNLLHTRDEVKAILGLDRDIDLIIPRGSKEFVRYIADNSRIPVLGHGEGICHVYVNRAADVGKAIEITVDSKVQYPAACNAAETLLVDGEIAVQFIPRAVAGLRSAGVEVRGCRRTQELVEKDEVVPAREDEWAREYSDLIISVKVVNDIDEAIEHIDTYGSRHTETIVTEDAEAATHFMEMVDAAGVFHNASTRFADGYRYGLGAELGISTGKLHARGPVGLEGLTTYRYELSGSGHTVAPYARGERTFKHQKQ